MAQSVEKTAEQLEQQDIRRPILQCNECECYQRAAKPERCIQCTIDISVPYMLDPLRRLALFEAVRTISLNTVMPFPGARTDEDNENAFQFALALEENCSWYFHEDPVCVQACWLALQERCPWADIDETAQAEWEARGMGVKPLPVSASQITYASLYFDLDFEQCAHLVEKLAEDAQEKWAEYFDAQLDKYGL